MKRKVRLKKSVIKKLKVIAVIFCLLLAVFIFYSSQINSLTRLGYSKEASRNILFWFKKEY